ncbi:MmgE/PrpD family protein [Streptomyces sp. Rer75]|uniref:MmgE/PrpD family protein n=1 Tax=Streptomyces sp. Rer75 TaxID=2750011 RepID=UPI0015D0A982|nr:MmgE/PrpD family protein [Streptomyces sp. Rer75]QLH19353.1 MmgE/PrpD family protein [Streptomyces sp. Rer75]
MTAHPGTAEVRHTQLSALADWASSLELDDVPERVRAFAASHVLSQLAAIRTGLGQEDGRRLVLALGEPLQQDVAQSARVLSGAGAWLNLDDTAYAGHLGPSTVGVSLAYVYHLGLAGADLLRAVILADECAARITAAATLGPFRGQTALHTHVVGAVAARLACQRATAAEWAQALALALSAPPWTLMRGFLTSDARLLHVPVGVRMGLDACDAALGGLRGAEDLLEHADGFLAQFAEVPLPETVTLGLGKRWHTETLSFKLHPGGPGIDAAIDCAADLHGRMGQWRVDDVSEVVVECSMYTLWAARKAEPYLNGANTPVGALVLTTPYPLATALLKGALSIEDFSHPAVDGADRWALAAKVRLVHDPEMTRTLMLGDAPFGEALRQAGALSTAWLHSFGGPELADLVGPLDGPLDHFEDTAKPTPARVTARMIDGRSYTCQYSVPRGAIGPDLRARHQELVAEKFRGVGGPDTVITAWPQLAEADPARLAGLIEEALAE